MHLILFLIFLILFFRQLKGLYIFSYHVPTKQTPDWNILLWLKHLFVNLKQSTTKSFTKWAQN